jgi:hypothetical protein
MQKMWENQDPKYSKLSFLYENDTDLQKRIVFVGFKATFSLNKDVFDTIHAC